MFPQHNLVPSNPSIKDSAILRVPTKLNGKFEMPDHQNLQRSKGDKIEALLTAFESAAHRDEIGDYWFARELRPLLGYSTWEKFQTPIDRAKAACLKAGEPIEHHFHHIVKMVRLGSRAEREIDDIELTRFACYLIAQNGDPTKRPQIAAAQTYFAIQTRRQEVTDLADVQSKRLTEDERRVLLREEIKEHNKSLASSAKAHGVVKPVEYAVFQNEGYKGLYGGIDKTGIQRRKGLTAKQNILDHMPSAELAANLFRATQTDEKLEKLRSQGMTGKAIANKTHFEIGERVRKTIQDIGGTMPEDYEAVEHVKEAKKRMKSEAKKALK
jgi:DNA-damage-inducible protein D